MSSVRYRGITKRGEDHSENEETGTELRSSGKVFSMPAQFLRTIHNLFVYPPLVLADAEFNAY